MRTHILSKSDPVEKNGVLVDSNWVPSFADLGDFDESLNGENNFRIPQKRYDDAAEAFYDLMG